MCKLWKKRYLCGCESHLFRDRCTTALRSPDDNCNDVEQEENLRKSYFDCYDCLKKKCEAERQEIAQAAAAAEELKKKEAEKLRAQQIRRRAEERAAREREEDARREAERKKEVEREKREGGAWQEMGGGGRRGKGRKGYGSRFGSEPSSPLTVVTNARDDGGGAGFQKFGVGAYGPLRSAPPTTSTMPAAGPKDSPLKENSGAVGVDPGGRAGRWGPSNKTESPVKQILKPDRSEWKK